MLKERIVPHFIGGGDGVQLFVELIERLHPFAGVHGGKCCVVRD